MANKHFIRLLLRWYEETKRDLPWRRTDDPYKIWLSEVLLQQTRVQQAIPYYHRFIETFPTVYELAKASESEVLRLWQGLGYYSRGRNLHAAAKQIVNDYAGILPTTFVQLLNLKGVGNYTAAAIASIAFNESVAVVDGNVYRVLSRIFGIDTDIASGKGNKEFAHLAHSLLPENDPGCYNQALMEFGALHCVPVSPKCNSCPFAEFCVAKINNIQHLLPVKISKLKRKKRYFHYLIFKRDEYILMRERLFKDIWKGLYEFCMIEKNEFSNFIKILSEEKLDSDAYNIIRECNSAKHILTHQDIYSTALVLEIKDENTWSYIKEKYNMNEYIKEEIASLPKPVLISKYLDELGF